MFCLIQGAMLVICDVNEYRKCVKEEMRIPIITQLFERLHALCNLLVVVPENLKVVRSGEQLVSRKCYFCFIFSMVTVTFQQP